MKPIQRKFLQRALIPLILAGAIAELYFTFRYTLVADVRERIANPDTTNLIAYGETLFQTRACATCHTLQSAGSLADEGPDLTGIASRHDAAYLRESIVTPNAVIAPQCPAGTACPAGVMPPFGEILDDQQVDALVAYLLEQR